MNMKIVFIAARSLDQIGGIETYMKNLCQKLARKGHEVHLYCEGGEFSKFEKYDINIITFKSFKNKFINKLYLGFVGTMHSLINNQNVDIYHYNAVASGLFSWMPRLLLKKVIFQGHGFEWKRAKWSPFQRIIIRLMDNFTLFINKNITMVSEEQSQFVKQNNNRSSITITPAINIPESLIYNSNILEEFGITKNKYILFLGRLVQEKNPDLLIKAFIKSKLNNIKLVIAGDDERSKEYIQSLHLLGVNNANIIFTGAVYGDDKEVLLRDCLSFCIPSSLEGLPITLLEAMSYRKFCIASDIPACKEALGENGLFFENENEEDLVSKLNSFQQLPMAEISNKAFERVKKRYTWDYVSERYEEYCHQILNNNQ